MRDFPFDANLPVKLVPVKVGTGSRIGFQGLSLAGLTVGKKNHSVAIEAAAEDQTDTRLATGINCRYTHSVGVRDCGHFFSCVKPHLERLHGVGIRLIEIQGTGKVHHRGVPHSCLFLWGGMHRYLL